MVTPQFEPVVPSQEDIALAKDASRSLPRVIHPGRRASLRESGDAAAATEPIEIPAAAVPLIQRLLAEMARGHAVAVIPIHAELTTQQAADLLGVSRPFVIKLLGEGKLPFRLVGTHRRITFKDLMDFKRRSDADRQKALDELTELAQDMGEY